MYYENENIENIQYYRFYAMVKSLKNTTKVPKIMFTNNTKTATNLKKKP